MKFLAGIQFRVWGRLGCLAISFLGLGWVLHRIDLAALADVFRHVRLGWFCAAFVLFGLDCLLAAWRWHLGLRLVNGAVHPIATTRAVFIGHFFNTLLLGPAGGDFAKSALYGRWYRFPMPQVLAGCFLDRILGTGGQVLFLGVTFALALEIKISTLAGLFDFTEPRLWFFVSALALLLAGCFVIRRRLRPESAVSKTVDAFVAGAKELLRRPGMALKGLVVSFFVQAALTGVLAFCLVAVTSQPISWGKLLWTFPVISLISGMPVTVSGAGVRESASLVLFGYYGIAGADAVAAALLTLSIYLLWALIGGLMLWNEENAYRRTEGKPLAKSISIVIPTLNEAEALPKALTAARQNDEVTEIIVTDGGSTDGTVASAERCGCRIVHAKRGRGQQMQAGSLEAKGDVILFLHADTILPKGAGRAVLDALRDATAVGGGFSKVFDRPTWPMAGSKLRCALRLLLFSRVFGDQGLFVRRDALDAVGGVPEIPLLEEVELCRRLSRTGRMTLAEATVVTSSRRFARLGVLRTYGRMARIMFLYYLGRSPEELRRLYDRE